MIHEGEPHAVAWHTAAVTSPRTLDPAEDSRLVEACLAGEPRAWEALVRRHERLVHAVARSYRLSDADIGDVFQEVFAALVAGLPRLRESRALVRWLSSTTQRIARATALRQRREQALSTGVDEISGLTAGDPPVGADLERLEEQAMIRLGLASLAPRCQRLLEALYYEDPLPSYSEIAHRLGLPMGSIGPTRARCIERLRLALEGLFAGRRIAGTQEPTFESGTGPPQGIRLGAFGEKPSHPVQEDRI